MASGRKNRNRIVVATPADPGKLSPQIGSAGVDNGRGAVDDGMGTSSEAPHASSASVPADSATTHKNHRRVIGAGSFSEQEELGIGRTV